MQRGGQQKSGHLETPRTAARSSRAMLMMTRRLARTASHLGCAPSRAFVASGDGDGGSGGNPSDSMVHTERDGIEYFNPVGSTAELSATPFSRVVRAGGMVYGVYMLPALSMFESACPATDWLAGRAASLGHRHWQRRGRQASRRHGR